MHENPRDKPRNHIASLLTTKGGKPEAQNNSVTDAYIYPLDDLGIIRINGADAGTFLQGQMTFDIRRISHQASSLCAFCNAKGRAFATARITKIDDDFLLVVPIDLLDPLVNKLRMYVLRSKVALNDASHEFDLIGTRGPIPSETARLLELRLPAAENEVAEGKNIIAVKTGPNNRFLLIAKPQAADQIRTAFGAESHFRGNFADWNLLEILDGIPTVTSRTSEEFVPQMLNLDRLNGISFDKGCYTGQEIVARSHYLGQLKRRTYLAQANVIQAPAAATQLVDCSNSPPQTAGKVVNAGLHAEGKCYLLAVLKIDSAERDDVRIEDCDGEPINLLELPYSVE